MSSNSVQFASGPGYLKQMKPSLRSLYSALLCAVLSGACGDGTGPNAMPLTVSVGLSAEPAFSARTTAEGLPEARCVVSLIAITSGAGKATWEDASFRWFAGTNRAAPLDSFSIPAAEIQQAWKSAEISGGETQTSVFQFWGDLPFELELSFRYRIGNSRKTANARFTCGPTVPPGGATAPTLSGMTLGPHTGAYEPGDTLVVSYRGASPTGVWLTAVEISGAFEADSLLVESLRTTTDRTVRFRIPANARLGVPASVTVFVVDAFGQQATQTILTTELVDETPPKLQLFMLPRGGGSYTSTFAGTYFVGDSITFLASASDNYSLSALLWEASPGTYRDSLVASAPFLSPVLKIPVRAEWVGGVRFRFTARDALGMTSATVETPAGAFKILPTIIRPSRSVLLSGDTRDVVVDQARRVIYLLHSNPRYVSVLPLSTMQLSQTVAMPSTPTGLDITPGGDSLLVALSGVSALAVIDLRQTGLQYSLLPLTNLDAAANQRPVSVRVAANGKAFVSLAGSTPSSHRLLEIDLATGAQRVRTDGPADGFTVSIERSLDHSVLVASTGTCLQSYDAATDAFSPCRGIAIPQGIAPHADRTGQRFNRSLDVYDASLAWLRRVESVSEPMGSYTATISADGEYVYHVIWGVGVLRSRVSDGALVDRTLLPSIEPTLVRVSPDGTTLILVENRTGTSSRIATIDLRPESGQAMPSLTDAAPGAVPTYRRPVPAVAAPAPARMSRAAWHSVFRKGMRVVRSSASGAGK